MVFFRDIFNATGARTRAFAPVAALVLLVSACSLPPEVDQASLPVSADALARGYIPLLPVAYFRSGAIARRGPDTLSARAAALRQRMTALSGPVLSSRDRARLEAALARHKPL